jgi:hypothetical protein
VVIRLPAVPVLDARQTVEGILDALNHAKLAPDKLQMTDIEPASVTCPSEPARVIRVHHHAAGAKGVLRNRLLAVLEVGSRPGSISASTALASR